MAGLAESKVEKIKRGTRAWARKKGISPESERGTAITFGTLRRMGWRRSGEARAKKRTGLREVVRRVRAKRKG